MRRLSWVMTPSKFQFIISSNRLVCITECMDLRSRISKSDLWHNVHIQYQEFLSRHSLVIKYVQEKSLLRRLGSVRLGMHMRRWFIVASWRFHLTTSSNHHVGITDCRKLNCRIWISDQRHNIHTKFHEYLSSHSLVIKYVQKSLLRRLGSVRLG
jgi:hypothetical protein